MQPVTSKNAALPQVFFCHTLRIVPKEFGPFSKTLSSSPFQQITLYHSNSCMLYAPNEICRFSAHIKKTWYDIAITRVPQKDSKTICLHFEKKQNYNANNITLSNNKLYKHKQRNKAPTFSNFCSVLFLFSYSELSASHFNRFYHLPLCCCKRF